MKQSFKTILSIVGLVLMMLISSWTGSKTRRDDRGHRLVRGSMIAWHYGKQVSAAAQPSDASRAFVADISVDDPVARVAALYERVCDRWKYERDPEGNRDWLRFSKEMLHPDDGFRGDCEDFAILISSLLQSFEVPIDCRIVLAGPSTDAPTGHAYVEIRVCDFEDYPQDTSASQTQLRQLELAWDVEGLSFRRDCDGIWLALDGFPPVKHCGERRLAIKPDGTVRHFPLDGNHN